MAPRVILVTGTSSGFGRCLVDAVLAQGDIAVATLRKPSVLDALKAEYGPDRLLVLPLDVTKQDQVDAAFEAVKETFGRLDMVINNAGTGVVDEIEATSDESGRWIMDTNFWGPLAMMKKAVAFMRDVNQPQGGQILNVSSDCGIRAQAGLGVYSASKHALEGISDAFADEIDPAWNITISVVEPGSFKTSVGGVKLPGPHPAYTNPSLPVNKMRAFFETLNPPGDPRKAARAMLAILDMPQGEKPRRFILGDDAIKSFDGKGKELLDLAEKNRATAGTYKLD
ncbi:hypothetical protein JCM10207_002247 [Rhodosporidiobolus poonsookiae]